MGNIRFFLLSILLLGVSYAYAQTSFGNATKFDKNWLFTLDDNDDYRTPSYDDSSWRAVNLPHDWSIEGKPSHSLASCMGYLPCGTGWYRKHFTVNDAMERHYIYFEGVYNRSEVYLNGHLLGKRPNGYVSFMYDMSPYLREGNNVLAVRVDHSRGADSRWYTGSGIYRDVYIVASHDVHFSLWGIGWKLGEVRNDMAEVMVDMQIDSRTDLKNHKVRAGVQLVDKDGKVVARKNVAFKGGCNKADAVLKVSKPVLWSLQNAYLYSLKCNLYVDGREYDTAGSRVGIRTFRFDPDNGFFLNDKNMKVKGVCLHHDAGVLGAVVPADVWRRRLHNIKEMGANAIRMSHNPQAPVVYDLCDEIGLLVMDEASDEWEFPKRKWISGWNVGKPGFEGSYDFFNDWIERDVTDMVRRDRNHASVFLWSIGNEVDYPNDPYSHPILDSVRINQQNFGGYKPDAPDAMRIGEIAKKLVVCVKNVDDSRCTTGALAGVVMSNQTAYPQAVDVVGYNYTEGRYDVDHATYPQRVIYGSETGTDISSWHAVRDKKHIFGQFVWTGTDYLGESGRWPSRGLNTGLLNFGSFMKPRGFFRASLWKETPVTYIGTYVCSKIVEKTNALWIDAYDSWNYDDKTKVRVACYTNSPQARLLLNGEVVGEMKQYDDRTGVIAWDIPFKAGKLTAEGCDSNGNVESSYTIVTSGQPYSLRCVADRNVIRGEGAVAHVTIEVVDDKGVAVKHADNEIKCDVSGSGRLLGLENSNNGDMSESAGNVRKAFNGRLLAYIQADGKGGDVTVRVSSSRLQSAEITIKVN